MYVRSLFPSYTSPLAHSLKSRAVASQVAALQRKKAFPNGLADVSRGQNKSVQLPLIQAKLEVGDPQDSYEKEADSMADTVVQRLAMPQTKFTTVGSIQRKGQDEEQVQTKWNPLVSRIQAKTNGTGYTPSTSFVSTLNSSKGGGRSLPKTTQREMEGAFGANFSQVKIHTGGEAIQMSQEIGAHAFTHGSNIYFNRGKFNPNTKSGKHLLAHELTHVIQQKPQSLIQRQIGEGATHSQMGTILERHIMRAHRRLTQITGEANRVVNVSQGYINRIMTVSEALIRRYDAWHVDNDVFREAFENRAHSQWQSLITSGVGELAVVVSPVTKWGYKFIKYTLKLNSLSHADDVPFDLNRLVRRTEYGLLRDIMTERGSVIFRLGQLYGELIGQTGASRGDNATVHVLDESAGMRRNLAHDSNPATAFERDTVEGRISALDNIVAGAEQMLRELRQVYRRIRLIPNELRRRGRLLFIDMQTTYALRGARGPLNFRGSLMLRNGGDRELRISPRIRAGGHETEMDQTVTWQYFSELEIPVHLELILAREGMPQRFLASRTTPSFVLGTLSVDLTNPSELAFSGISDLAMGAIMTPNSSTSLGSLPLNAEDYGTSAERAAFIQTGQMIKRQLRTLLFSTTLRDLRNTRI